ncbi:hypothetical protein Lfu02_12970 [Longispora fulva]|uniref:Uncharacterized protein n=1 Tax=Longispora fulva TaxID=619741 RepID=A0A8J7GFB7_9ACTN|nr:hypothetical protein [Longispora fulva]MBG6134843.1 hypothetical protein [Longispora fulva]GIG56925.1 hypothetical protein Lfu02_12970 [Longispora fulva]
MSTERLRTLFDETAGPDVLGPPGIDLDAVIGRERGARTRRRVFAVGGATLAVAALALALPTVLTGAVTGAAIPGGPGTRAADPAASAAPTGTPTASPGPRGREEVAGALTAVLGTRIRELLPAATFVPLTEQAGRAGALQVFPSQAIAFKAGADIADSGGTSTLSILIMPQDAPAEHRSCPRDVSLSDAPEWNCTWSTPADGSLVLESSAPAAAGIVAHEVVVYRAGYMVLVKSANYGYNSVQQGKNMPRPAPQRATPAVDVAIARDLADRLSLAL